MEPLRAFAANWDDFRAQFGNELRLGACIVLMRLITAVMRSGGGDRAPEPASKPRKSLELVASPNDPLMIQAIQIVRMPSSNNGPWGAAPVRRGPTKTFQSPGGPVTLTHDEILNANSLYYQIKANPAILRGTRSSRSSAHSGEFSEDLSGNW